MTTNMGGSCNTNPRDQSNDVVLNVTRTMGDEKNNAAVGAFVAANDHRGPKMGTVGAFGNVNSNGHGLSVGVNHTPKFNMTTVEATAKANLWTSSNQNTSINAHATHSQHVSGPMTGFKSNNYGFGINHRF
ncbi:attacin-A-like [Lucilia sericata]|uniref:attacin-A-like n=1 Tax=Lucilia sericata TaxID=13632 RepID=UPI0018A8324C|nr:attacin-A-like [Lucilia sericata]